MPKANKPRPQFITVLGLTLHTISLFGLFSFLTAVLGRDSWMSDAYMYSDGLIININDNFRILFFFVVSNLLFGVSLWMLRNKPWVYWLFINVVFLFVGFGIYVFFLGRLRTGDVYKVLLSIAAVLTLVIALAVYFKKVNWLVLLAVLATFLGFLFSMVITFNLYTKHQSEGQLFDTERVVYRKASSDFPYIVHYSSTKSDTQKGYKVVGALANVFFYDNRYYGDVADENLEDLGLEAGNWVKYWPNTLEAATFYVTSDGEITNVEGSLSPSNLGVEEVEEEIVLDDEEYAIEEEEWTGGPAPIPPFRLVDFYQSVISSAEFHLWWHYAAKYPKKDRVSMYLAGLRGLLYTGVYSGVHNFMKGYDSERDFWDISAIDQLIGMPLYDESKADELGFKFDCYNTDAVNWLFDNLVPAPNQYLADRSMEEWYHLVCSRFFRLMFESYLSIYEKGMYVERELFEKQVIFGSVDAIQYVKERFDNIPNHYFIDYWEPTDDLEERDYDIYKPDEETYLVPSQAVSFWLRRMADGSDEAFLKGFLKVLNQYDEDWVSREILSLDKEDRVCLYQIMGDPRGELDDDVIFETTAIYESKAISFLQAINETDESIDSASYKFTYYPISGHAVAEALVRVEAKGHCGSGGCDIYVLDSKYWGLLKVGELFGRTGVMINSDHNGMSDLLILRTGGGALPYYDVAEFDGRRYVRKGDILLYALTEDFALTNPAYIANGTSLEREGYGWVDIDKAIGYFDYSYKERNDTEQSHDLRVYFKKNEVFWELDSAWLNQLW